MPLRSASGVLQPASRRRQRCGGPAPAGVGPPQRRRLLLAGECLSLVILVDHVGYWWITWVRPGGVALQAGIKRLAGASGATLDVRSQVVSIWDLLL